MHISKNLSIVFMIGLIILSSCSYQKEISITNIQQAEEVALKDYEEYIISKNKEGLKELEVEPNDFLYKRSLQQALSEYSINKSEKVGGFYHIYISNPNIVGLNGKIGSTILMIVSKNGKTTIKTLS